MSPVTSLAPGSANFQLAGMPWPITRSPEAPKFPVPLTVPQFAEAVKQVQIAVSRLDPARGRISRSDTNGDTMTLLATDRYRQHVRNQAEPRYSEFRRRVR